MSKLNLRNVTLLTATSVHVDFSHAALIHSAGCADFGAVKMLSSVPTRVRNSGIEYHYIPPMLNLGDYSRFMIDSLNNFVDTEFCLVIQMDGFILNPQLWNDEFFKYDYIGAPFPDSLPLPPPYPPLVFDKNLVGNGGFSLRSKKLLEHIARTMKFDKIDEKKYPVWGEDIIICHYFYDEFCAAGIRYPDPDLAAKFAIDHMAQMRGQTLDTTFGFHGKHWFAKELGAKPYPLLRDVLKRGDA